jgi:MFS family permease
MVDVQAKLNSPASAKRIKGPPLQRAMRLVTLAWVFGIVWITAISGAPITRFATHLRASNFQFGVLSALPFLSSLLAMPGSLLADRTGKRKQIFMVFLLLQRVMWFPIAIVPFWLWKSESTRHTAMPVFLAMLFVMYSVGNIGGPGWTGWMADLVPGKIRGKYFSRRRQWAILSAIPAAWFVGWLMDRHRDATPAQVLGLISLIFCASAVFGIADISLFAFVPDIPTPPKPPEPFWRSMARPLRNPQFLWFGGFVATLIFAVSFMGNFVTLYLLEKVGLGNSGTQWVVLIAPMQLLTFGIWGKAADRMGKKPVLAIAALGLVPVGFGWCFVTPHTPWLGWILTGVGGLLWCGVDVTNTNLVLEMSGSTNEENGSAYVAVNGVITQIAGMLGGLASGIIAECLRSWHWQPIPGGKTITFYEVLFALSGVLRLLAVVVFLPRIHEPDAKTTIHTLRYMTSNFYNNLFGAIAQPLRLISRVKR